MEPLLLHFYLDVMSPYTYLAWKVLGRYRSVWDLQVVLRPFFLGAIMQGSGNQPPAMVPNRAAFMHADILRTVRWIGIEDVFKHMPSNFFQSLPKLSLKVNRLLAATSEPRAQWALTDAAFTAIWELPKYRENESNDFLYDEAEFFESLFAAAGLPFPGPDGLEALVAKGRDLVKAHTQEALRLGAFGAPVFHYPGSVDEKIFFGSDRWEQMAFVFRKPWSGPTNLGRCKL